MKKNNEDMKFLGVDGFSEIESITPETEKKNEKHTAVHAAKIDITEIMAKLGKKLKASKVKSQPVHTKGGAREHTVYKKRVVLSVAAGVTATMLSVVTAASALDGSGSPAEKKPAAAPAPAVTVADEPKEKAEVKTGSDPAALYIDGELKGAVENGGKLETMLNQMLLDAKEGYDSSTTTTFANSVEVKPYSGKSYEDVNVLLAKVQDSLSIKLETDWVYETEVAYETEVVYDDTMPADQEEITQEGVNGVSKITYRLTYIAGVQVDAADTDVEVVTEPVKEKKVIGTYVKPGEATGEFMWPVPHTHTVSSYMEWRWGRMHNGIDIAGGGDYGEPFLASDGGTVIWSGNDGGGYGNYVMIDHGNGYVTVYGHACELACSTGDYVNKGDVIGYIGSTGNSTGPHLHFEIRLNGEYQNPLDYVS